MGSSQWTASCPRCGGQETVEVYSETRPLDLVCSTCMACGLTTRTVVGLLDLEQLDGERLELGMPSLEKLAPPLKEWAEARLDEVLVEGGKTYDHANTGDIQTN